MRRKTDGAFQIAIMARLERIEERANENNSANETAHKSIMDYLVKMDKCINGNGKPGLKQEIAQAQAIARVFVFLFGSGIVGGLIAFFMNKRG